MNLRHQGLLVNSSLSPLFKAKMLHSVSHIHLLPVNAGVLESAIQKFSRRADERLPRAVLLIAGLFAHQHQSGVGAPLTKHSLCGVQVQITALTVLRCLLEQR